MYFLGVLSSFFLAFYWSPGVGTFLQAPALASHWLEDFADITPTARKLTNKTPLTLHDAPALSCSKPVNYTTLVISKDRTKKPLT